MGKLSSLPGNASPTVADYLIGIQSAGGPTDDKVLISDLVKLLFPTWTTVTPTWTNLTPGNAPQNSLKYMQIGKLVICTLYFTLGSTSAVGSNPYFAPPVTPASYYINAAYPLYILNSSGLISTAANVDAAICFNQTLGTILQPVYKSVSGSNVIYQGLSATTPGTFGTGNYMVFDFIYEAA